jgi:2-oxoglutarate ferredoxin oxidoreductase subunit gamma
LYEQSTIIHPPTRDDIEIVCVPANEEADKLKTKQVANMIMVGAFLAKRPIVKMETIVSTLKKVLPEHRHHMIPVNEQALKKGSELAQEEEKINAI